MAWSVDANLGSATGAATATTLGLTTSAAAASNTWIFLAIGSGSSVNVSSISGGSLAWEVVQSSSTSPRATLARAWAPSGLSSGTTITVTYSATTTERRVGATSFAGGDADSTEHGPLTGSGSTAAWSQSVTSHTNTALHLAVASIGAANSNTPDANSTEDQEVVGSASSTLLSHRIVNQAFTPFAVGGTWSAAGSWQSVGSAFSTTKVWGQISVIASGTLTQKTAGLNPQAISVTANVGDVIVVMCGADDISGADSIGTSAVTDSAGNTYTRIASNQAQTGATACAAAIFATKVTTAMTGSGTITFTADSSAVAKVMAIRRFAGGTISLNGTAGAGNGTGAPSGITAGSSAAAGDLVIGMCIMEGDGGGTAFTADSDTDGGVAWSAQAQNGTTGGSAVTNVRMTNQYKITQTGATVTYNPAGPTGDHRSLVVQLALTTGSALTQSVPDTGTWADDSVRNPDKNLAETATWADAISRVWAAKQPVADTGTWADAQAKAPKKSLAETATWADNVVALRLLIQAVNDTFAVADALLKAPKKPLAETLGVADALANAPKKPLAEALGVTDALAKAPKKPLADGISVADTMTHFWVARQTVAEGGTWTDALAKTAKHPVADTASWADGLTPVIAHLLTQSVPDTFAVVDALTRRPGKGLAETLSFADALARTARKNVADVGTWADNWGFGGGKIQSVGETISIADAILKAPKHPVADTGAWVDALARAAGKAQADTATAVDARSLKPGKGLAESLALADAVKNAPRKNLADVLTAIDQVFPGGGKIKVVGDTFAIADALLKAQTHPLADAISVADAASKGPRLAVADTFSIVDDVILPFIEGLARIARLFFLTQAEVTRTTEAVVAYNSAATTPIRETALDTTGYASGVSAVAYATNASPDAYETGIIVVETDLELT